MRWLRFLIGLLIALTLHSMLDSFFPSALAFFNPYVILVVYYSMGGNVFGAIVAGVIAGLVQDAYSGAIFGLHALHEPERAGQEDEDGDDRPEKGVDAEGQKFLVVTVYAHGKS